MKADNLSIAFLGDVSLNDTYVSINEQGKNPFEGFSKNKFNFDYMVGNLECMSEGACGENEDKIPRLTTTLRTLNLLNVLGLDCVTLAHNHVYDNLLDGFVKTKSFLEANSIASLGAGLSKQDATLPNCFVINDISVCMLNYVTKDTNPKIPNGAGLHINTFDEERILTDISKFKDFHDYVVLLFHWGGGHEGGFYPERYQIDLSKRFIDHGADLIIGGHPHTIQPYEVYKGKYIFYSLGNFCFSDIERFNYEVNRNRGMESIAVEVLFNKNNYDVNLIPLSFKGHQVKVDLSVLRRLKFRSKIFTVMQKIRVLHWVYHYYHKYAFPVYYYLFGNDRNPITQLRNIKLDKIKFYLFGR